MNLHAFLDHYTVLAGVFVAGRRKFFSQSLECPTFSKLLETTSLQLPEIHGEGLYEAQAETPIGTLDPAFYVAQWLGGDYPTLIYHHGNNERPFDFGAFSKNSFKHVVLAQKGQFAANLIALRAPYHQSLTHYMGQITHLVNFATMLAVSVQMIEALQAWSYEQGSASVMVTGISLGGWVTNLHRAFYNTADLYAPLLAGAALDEVFTGSAYRRLTGVQALSNPARIRHILNFEVQFASVNTDNIFPLLARHDQIIVYDRQKQCYGERPITVLEKGHTTAALDYGSLRDFLLTRLQQTSQIKSHHHARLAL
jgi:predicted esterase YcpF (UPF0227 family)